MPLDAHGQPLSPRFNQTRRTDRDISEFLGLAKGLLADGQIAAGETDVVAHWLLAHGDTADQWPLNVLAKRITAIYADGVVEDAERIDLAELLRSIVGGATGVILGEDAATELPLDVPPPALRWKDAVYVLTGKFACGTRSECQRRVVALGGVCEADITHRTDYLVVGTFGSRDWIHTSFGRKIEKAVEYRSANGAPLIVGEDHWAGCLGAAG